jgi:hypothetical protein
VAIFQWLEQTDPSERLACPVHNYSVFEESRKEAGLPGTQMAVACPNDCFLVGGGNRTAVYKNLAVFCKIQVLRNTISHLLHCITHEGSLLVSFDGNLRGSKAEQAKPKAVNT